MWWGLQGHVARSIERVALWSYLLFALSALPMLVPIAVGLVERSRTRRYVVGAFGVVAIAVGTALATAMFRGPSPPRSNGGTWPTRSMVSEVAAT